MKISRAFFCVAFVAAFFAFGPVTVSSQSLTELDRLFAHPPEEAKPGALWMWMGSNISKTQITRDLEALKAAGYNRTSIFFMADMVNPWAFVIGKSPTPDLISWTEPWWKYVRFAMSESRRLNMKLGIFNGSGYESSGGPWITPDQSMKEMIWSQRNISGTGNEITMWLPLPNININPRAVQPFPVYNPATNLIEKPVIPARMTYFREIAVLAVPARGSFNAADVIDLSGRMEADGTLHWTAPQGDWTVYRFGYTTRGTLIQPAQPKATGLECDKMDAAAVNFHMDHILGAIQKHIGDYIGNTLSYLHFDSYEAGVSNWTPRMAEEFRKRRGYDLIALLPTFAGRTVGDSRDSAKLMTDFRETVKDLFRDNYFITIANRLKAANMPFSCEPYGGPWRQDDVLPLIDNVMVEFWTDKGKYTPYQLDSTVDALRKLDHNIIEAEAFTGKPQDSKWSEYPALLKPIGDEAFCKGVNRFMVHRFSSQPWDDKYRPGGAMGQWGTHFDRTQTWWEPGKAMVAYWQRCQALLQWGAYVKSTSGDLKVEYSAGDIRINGIHRRKGNTDLYFIANNSHAEGEADCYFDARAKAVYLWDPVTMEKTRLGDVKQSGGLTRLRLSFADAQSWFVVFTDEVVPAPESRPSTTRMVKTLTNPWSVVFDSKWGGPVAPVMMNTLKDWTAFDEKGIKYYSGTAKYSTAFDLGPSPAGDLYLDLGKVNHIARVTLNGNDLGVVWTAPWRVKLSKELLRPANNRLTIDVTNLWANRLIGDDQEPDDLKWEPSQYSVYSGRSLKEFPDWLLQKKPRPSRGRYTFTVWDYFTKDSPLVSSGLLGPVTIATR